MSSRQIPIRPITIAGIMAKPAFELGLSDVRRGIPFDWRVVDWSYERGRLFGYIAPLDMPLRVSGKLNPKAVALCSAAFERRLIL